MSREKAKMKLDVRIMTLIAAFTALIAVGAFLRIPGPVPKTFQLFFTVLAGLLLGSRGGAASAGLYVLLGLCGVPLFTQGGGFSYVLHPNFGYLIGFIVGAWVIGRIVEQSGSAEPSIGRLLCAAYVGMIIVYVIGVVWLFVITNYVLGVTMSAWKAFMYGFLVLVPGDIVLCGLAAFLARRLRKAMRFM